MIEVNNLALFHLQMIGVNQISMISDRLMSVCLNTMLVTFTAVIVLRIQMRMRGRPLGCQEGNKQKNNKCCIKALLNHEWMSSGLFPVSHNV